MSNEAVSLLDLPFEALEVLLAHFDLESGKKAALVCRAFYEHICYAQRKRSQRLVLRDKVNRE